MSLNQVISGTTANNVDVEVGGKASSESKKEDAAKKPAMVRLLAHPIPHFLGYRRPVSELHPKQRNIKPYPSLLPFVHYLPPMLESILWTWIGAFVGISAVSLVFARPNVFTSSVDLPPHPWMSPIIIGSFGASSVLLYATPSSPLGQPRSFVGGQFFSALSGVCATKLFRLSVHYNLNDTDTSTSLVWLAGSVSTASALVVMMMTGTLHPPGGATALLCATNSQVERLGWKVIPIVLLSSFIMLFWSLIWMNLGRKRYPESFFAPSPPNANAGNVSEAIIDLVKKQWFKSQESKESPSSSLDDEKKAAPPSSPQKPQPRLIERSKGDNDPWQDEVEWRNIEEEQDEEQETEERQERPSRWDTKPNRTLC